MGVDVYVWFEYDHFIEEIQKRRVNFYKDAFFNLFQVQIHKIEHLPQFMFERQSNLSSLLSNHRYYNLIE